MHILRFNLLPKQVTCQGHETDEGMIGVSVLQ